CSLCCLIRLIQIGGSAFVVQKSQFVSNGDTSVAHLSRLCGNLSSNALTKWYQMRRALPCFFGFSTGISGSRLLFALALQPLFFKMMPQKVIHGNRPRSEDEENDGGKEEVVGVRSR